MQLLWIQHWSQLLYQLFTFIIRDNYNEINAKSCRFHLMVLFPGADIPLQLPNWPTFNSGKEVNNGVFLKCNQNSVNSSNSGNLINHWSMNWDQFKDLVCYLCLTGAVVTSWPLTQEAVGLNNLFQIQYFCHWIRWIQCEHSGKTKIQPMFVWRSC